MKKLKLYEDFLNESDAYTISRMANDIGLVPAQDFLDSHNVNIELLKKDISQGTINKYDLRDIIRGNAPSSKIKKFIKTYVNESVVNEAKTLTRDSLMNLLETKYKIKTVRTSEEFNGQTEGIWMAADNEEELSGNKIFDYYNRSAKYANGVLKTFRTAVEKTGWWFEWNDPGTIICWPKNLAESTGHSSQLGRINESEIIHHKYDFEGMWAQKLRMTREEYVAHFATMTAGVDEAKLKDIKGKQFEVKGANFTYVEQTRRFYGVYLYDVAKTSNVADRLKLSSIADANEFLALHGITEQLPYRYDEKELDVICKKLAKQGVVCNHNDNFDVS